MGASLAFLSATVLLGAVALPENVGSPGAGRVALGAGIEGTEPAAELRIGVFRFLTVFVEGTWHSTAPLVGGGVRVAAGRTRRLLFASAWAEGHFRPVLTTDITETLAGSDAAGGLGVALVAGWAVAQLDGGLQLGIPVYEVDADVDPDAVDQQGGLFVTQRLRLGVQLFDLLELAVRGSASVPIDSVDLNRRDREVLGRWDLRLGGQVLLRF